MTNRPDSERLYYLGIDGEGQDDPCGEHIYVMLAAANESGTLQRTVENRAGLSTVECFEFLLSLPSRHTKAFAFAFQYDITKILRDVDPTTLYLLFHPAMRKRFNKKTGHSQSWPIKWCPKHGGSGIRAQMSKACCAAEYKVNMLSRKFTIKHDKTGRYIVIWDIFGFYQSRFTQALKDWKAAPPDRIKHMEEMKDKRDRFNQESPDAVRAYCLEECRYMATLARLLTDAHTDAGLELRNYYGAGSSAAAMLKLMGIKDVMKKNRTAPDEMRIPIAQAFFGGRFENSVIGTIRDVVYDRDISSAYPYQIYFLPCLIHGMWTYTSKESDLDTKPTTALVRYRITERIPEPWAPFPFREPDGTISYPAISSGGWIWLDEYRAGANLFPQVEFREAWLYHTSCKCRPFLDIAKYYVERLKIGKEGKGIVIKLGVNSCYGKLAQSIGSAPFNNWIWAGLITSGTRAWCLRAMAAHKDISNLLMIATDGIKTREKLNLAKPKNTNTDKVFVKGELVRKPLGGWESKTQEKGIFLARPGIYFPLDPTEEELKDVKARGIGKKVLYEFANEIVDKWEKQDLVRDEANPIYGYMPIKNVRVFRGIKSSLSFSSQRFPGVRRSDDCGQWVPRKIDMSFDPMPKRAGIAKDGRTLLLREMRKGLESAPYDPAMISQESAEIRLAKMEAEEQPDGVEIMYDD